MTYNQTEDKWKEKVETALTRYMEDVNDVSAGYNVLRYAEKGLLKGTEFRSEIAQALTLYEFSPEHNANCAYTILNAARKGFLEYRQIEFTRFNF